MPGTARVFRLVAGAAVVGAVLGVVKGDSAGLRAGIGNLSAPWLLIGLFAGAAAGGGRRSVLAGTAATAAALGGFYLVLTSVLSGHLGGGGAVREFAVEVNANRIYFLFGAMSGPVCGFLGGRLARRPGWTAIAAGGLVAAEIVVVALVGGRQLLPAPVYFAWGVDDWRPYFVECFAGLVVLAWGLHRRGPAPTR